MHFLQASQIVAWTIKKLWDSDERSFRPTQALEVPLYVSFQLISCCSWLRRYCLGTNLGASKFDLVRATHVVTRVQDAHEFLTNLLDNLHEEVNQLKQRHMVEDVDPEKVKPVQQRPADSALQFASLEQAAWEQSRRNKILHDSKISEVMEGTAFS